MKFDGDNLKSRGKTSFKFSFVMLAIALGISAEAHAWQIDEVQDEPAAVLTPKLIQMLHNLTLQFRKRMNPKSILRRCQANKKPSENNSPSSI